MDIKTELSKHGITGKLSSRGGKVLCPKCSHQRKNKRDPCLSVTIMSATNAVWNCHHCNWSGSVGKSETFSNRDVKPRKVFKKPEKTDSPSHLMDWFANRGIHEDTVKDFGIYEIKRKFGTQFKNAMVFPYVSDGKILNNKYRTYEKQFMQESQATPVLFNIDSVKSHWEKTNEKVIVFVEGELDAMAMWESGITYAVSLPTGAPESVSKDESDKRFDPLKTHDWLSDAEKVIIATDADAPGRCLRDELAFRFGEEKCWLVPFGKQKVKDANEFLIKYGKEKLKEYVENALPYPVHGLHNINEFSEQLDKLYDGNFEKPISLGFGNLDEYLKILRGSFNVITGIPNHGKSTFIDQVMVNLSMQNGMKFVIFSPEGRKDFHIVGLIEKYVGKPFFEGLNPRMSREEMHAGREFLDKHFQIITCKEEIPSIDWILSRVKSSKLKFGIDGFVIDPYNEIDASREKGVNESEHINMLISKIKHVCHHHNLICFMVAHPKKLEKKQDGTYPKPTLYDISGSAHWNSRADNGIIVWRDEETSICEIDVKKIRDQPICGKYGQAYFKLNPVSRRYEPTEEPSEVRETMGYEDPYRD